MKRNRARVEHSVWEKGEKIARRGKERMSTVSVLANRSLHQDRMHSGCRGTTAPNVCLRALSLSLCSPRNVFTLSPNKESACSQAMEHVTRARVKRAWIIGYLKCRSPLLFSSFDDLFLKK